MLRFCIILTLPGLVAAGMSFSMLWGNLTESTEEQSQRLAIDRKRSKECMLYPHPEVFGRHKDFVGDYMTIVQYFISSLQLDGIRYMV